MFCSKTTSNLPLSLRNRGSFFPQEALSPPNQPEAPHCPEGGITSQQPDPAFLNGTEAILSRASRFQLMMHRGTVPHTILAARSAPSEGSLAPL